MKTKYDSQPVITYALNTTLLLLCLFLPILARGQYSFAGVDQFPSADVAESPIEGSDGMLYGTTWRSLGPPNYEFTGTAYRIRKDGTGFQVLFDSLTLTGGVYQTAYLFEAGNGKLYGFALETQLNEQSLLYRMNRDGSAFEVLRRLPEDLGVQGTLLGLDFSFETPDGWLYGVGLLEIFRCRVDGSQFSILHTFGSVSNDGEEPYHPILGSDGRIYGVCHRGGTGNGGIIYRIEQNGSGYQILRRIPSIVSGAPCRPLSVFKDTDGGLVGTTSDPQVGSFPPQVLFKLGEDGSGYRELFRFGVASQGATNLFGGLKPGIDGFLYGRTLGGGSFGKGTAFRIRPSGMDFTILYHFGATPPVDDQANLSFSILEHLSVAGDGNLYGSGNPFGTPPNAFVYSLTPPRLQLAATLVGDLLQLAATGTTNTEWRLEFHDTLIGTNAWQPLTNIALGVVPFLLDQPLDAIGRFYRGAWVP